jgi:hypothetical protein
MNKVVLFFLTLCATGFAENLVLENQTPYPSKKTKIAVQWATNGREVDEGNHAIMQGTKLNQKTLQVLKQTGKVDLSIPKKAEYFRVLAWSKGEGEPDLVTNWVEIVPNKVYKLATDHLVPAVLMLGTGC